MKNLALLALATSAVGLAVANAQTEAVYPPGGYPGGGYYGAYPTYHHASTAAEGRLRGMGDVVRSMGQANLDNSAAAINYSQARRNEIENRQILTDTYFEMRKANKAYRAAERGPRASMEDLVRYAQAGKPKQLSPSQVDIVTGAINWPVLLRSEAFAEDRSALEAVFARRASNSVIGSKDYLEVKQTTDEMLASLNEQIREVPAYEFMIAKRFLESLAYGAGTPAT